MSSTTDQASGRNEAQKRYKGVLRRKWGKWVSEIRVPGKQDRLWLGSYSMAKAAAVAHDIASYCLRGPSSINSLNFPLTLPVSVRGDMSPKSIQKAASDAGMAVDAHMILNRLSADHDHKEVRKASESGGGTHAVETQAWEDGGETEGRDGNGLKISIEDYL